MAFNKDERNFLNALNHAIEEWNDLGIMSNSIQAIKDELWLLYDDIGRSPKHEDMFNTRMQLTPEQEDRMMDIANAMYNDSHNFLGTYEQLQQERGFETLSETVDFINMAEEFEEDEFYSTIFDSEEYIEIFQYAEEKGMSRNKVEAKIMKLYKKKGLTHGKLSNRIFRFIDDYTKEESDNEENNW